MKIIFQAADIVEAHLVAGLLQSEGIEAHVSGHYLQGAIGDISPVGFANVLIPEEGDIPSRAAQIIQHYESNGYADPAVG